MKMVWNWDTANTIVFGWWNTESWYGLLFSCIIVMLISLAYEGVGCWQRFRDREAATQEATYASLGVHHELAYVAPGRLQRSLLYGMRTFLGIFCMLIMMTFNGFIISSIVIGSIIGHYLLGYGSVHH